MTQRLPRRRFDALLGEPQLLSATELLLEPLPGEIPATIRGQWDDSPTHKDRFEASTAYGANGFRKISQSQGETTITSDGHTAIRVNVPPIGFNQVRIRIQIEGTSAPIV